MLGFGGSDRVYLEDATLVFFGAEKVYYYELSIGIMKQPATHDDDAWDLPSVLGRDVLHNWRMLYHPQGQVLDLDVLTADNQMALDQYLRLQL